MDLLATFNLFDKSPAFLNFSSPQLVRWSAYCMQKSACKKTQDFYWFFIWKVYSGIPRPTGQKKKRKTNEIPAPWTMLDAVKLRGKGSLAQHWPRTMNTAQNYPKPQTLGCIDKKHCRVLDPNTDLPCWLKTSTSIHITDFKKSPYPSQPPTPSALWKQNTTLLRTNTSIRPVEKDQIMFKMAFLRWYVGSQKGYLHPSNVHRASRALEKALWFDRCHKVCSPLPLRVGSDTVKVLGTYSCCDLVTHKS